MGKYEKILIIFIVVLISFFVIVLFQMRNTRAIYNEQKESNSLVKTEGEMEKRLKDLEKKQNTLMIMSDKNIQPSLNNNKKIVKEASLKAVDIDLVKYLVTETINSENLKTKTRWQQTNSPGISVVAVNLDFEPVEESIMVWSGMGLLPVDSYRMQEAKLLLIIFQQPQEAFISGNNYINIRYFKKQI